MSLPPFPQGSPNFFEPQEGRTGSGVGLRRPVGGLVPGAAPVREFGSLKCPGPSREVMALQKKV